MASSTSGSNRMQYEKKAGDYLTDLLKWMRENLLQAMDVTYKGVTQPLIQWVKGGATSQATQSIRDLINAVASACLSTCFAEALPDYPSFSILITQASRAQAAQEAVRWLGGGLKTRQGTAVLDALGLLDGDKIRATDSRYGAHFLARLRAKGEGQVLNRSELIAGSIGAEADVHFGLEPEWVAVVLLGLVYAGELALALPGTKIEAGNLDEAVKLGVETLANWKYVQRPKGVPMAALTALCELLGLPTGLITDSGQHETAVAQMQKRVGAELDRLVAIRQRVQKGLPVWEAALLDGPGKADLVGQLDGHKAFLESLQAYNTPGKLRNFRYTADEVKAQAGGQALLNELASLIDTVAAIQPLTAYLSVAMAVLPTEHEWTRKAMALRSSQLAQLRQRDSWRQPYLRTTLGGALENLKSAYIDVYLKLHRRARLNAAEDARKKKLVSDPRHRQVTALSAIDFLPVADLKSWEAALTNLLPCYAVGASELADHAICPHCGYRPVEEPAPKPAHALLEEQADRLNQIHANWNNALLANLTQETTQANIALMTAEQRALLKGFIDSGALPASVSYAFVDTVKEALTDLERIAIPPEDILLALTAGGMPCTVQALLSRFRAYVDRKIDGKDANKVRIVVEW